MNINEIKRAGFARGWNVASWIDMPEMGAELPRDIDYMGIGEIETRYDQIDAWEMLCSHAESFDREFTPFEFIAHAINSHRDSEYAWDCFDSAIARGIAAYRRKHYPLNRKW